MIIYTKDFELPCLKCTGVNGAHFLTCPSLNLTPGWYDRLLEKEGWL